nr:MAG TPA: hypothetical protein [Caudoviricetes sp.]
MHITQMCMWCGNNHIADAMCVAADINLLSLFTFFIIICYCFWRILIFPSKRNIYAISRSRFQRCL